MFLVRDGQLERAQSLTVVAVQMSGKSAAWVEPVFDAFGEPANVPAALVAVDQAWAERQITPQVALVVRSLLGDIDGAMSAAKLLDSDDEESFEMELLFVPELKALRQHPEFLPLLERLNVTEYWDANNCHWNGDEVTCPDD